MKSVAGLRAHNAKQIYEQRDNEDSSTPVKTIGNRLKVIKLREFTQKNNTNTKKITVSQAMKNLEQRQKETGLLVDVKKFKQNGSLLIKMISDRELNYMRLMHATPTLARHWQTKRIQTAIAMGCFMVILGYCFNADALLKNMLIAVALFVVGAAGLYFYYGFSLQGNYKRWLFKRELQFGKFQRLLVPYLIDLRNGGSLYHAITTVATRLEEPEDRALVANLLRGMKDKPGSDEPFITFAQNFSGNTGASVFMVAVNEQRNADPNQEDDGVIRQLANEANKDLMRKVEQVRLIKSKKFNLTADYMVLVGMLMTLIILAALAIAQFSVLGEIMGN